VLIFTVIGSGVLGDIEITGTIVDGVIGAEVCGRVVDAFRTDVLWEVGECVVVMK